MINFKDKPYYQYLSPRIKQLMELAYPKELEQQQFAKTYLPPLGKRFSGDIMQIVKSLPKIPGTLWQTTKEALAEGGAGYDISKPFWKQGKGYTAEGRKQYFENLKKASLSALVPGYNLFETIAHMPYVSETKFGKAIPKTPISEIANKFLLESMIKGTGSFVYDPESAGRKWFPKPSEGTRYQQYKEHPVLTGLEDIVNVAIVAAPILRATGAGAKLAKLPAIKKVTTLAKESSMGQDLLRFQQRLGQRATFGEMFGTYRKRQFFAREGITYSNKFMRAFANVPDDAARTIFKVAEGTADWTDDVARLMYKEAQTKGYTLSYNVFKNSADDALRLIKRESIKETNYLVKSGYITAEQAEKASWMPAVRKHLIDTGKYTASELDDLLIKNKGFAKNLADEFKIALTELKEMGIDKPTYMPHMWEKYLSSADFYGKQPLYKYTPPFLKKRVGYGGYIDEPVTVLTRHELQMVKWKQATSLVDDIINRYGKTIGDDGILAGYRQYYPEGFLKQVMTKNPKLKAGLKIQLPDFMASELNKVFNAPAGFEKFARAVFDPATNTWRTSVLALSPRWVFNNFFGNMALNVAGGVNPLAYWKAAGVMKKARVLAKKQGWSVNKALRKLGIPEEVSRGLYSAEARSAASRIGLGLTDTAPVQSRFAKALNYTGVPQIAKGMYRFNSGIESFFRTAHYLDKMGKTGFNKALAIKSVNEFLFDYSALTYTERTVLRRILPFYSWQKNITRLVATYPFKYPARTALLQKVNALVEEPEEMDYRFLPEHMMDYLPTNLKAAGEKLYLSTRGINPFADVGVNLGNINPMLKLLIERSTGMNLFKGRQFTSPYRTYASTEKILPSLGKHIASQFPQYQLYQNLRYPYAKYDTGEPILSSKTGEPVYTRNPLLDVLKMFGINLTPYDMEQMKQQGIEEAMQKQKQIEKFNKLLEQYKANR